MDGIKTSIIDKKDLSSIQDFLEPFLLHRMEENPNMLCQVALLKGKILGACVFEISDDLCNILELNVTEIGGNVDVRKTMLEDLIRMLGGTDCKVLTMNLYEDEEKLEEKKALAAELGFQVSDQVTYFERFSLNQACKGMLSRMDSNPKNVFLMNEVGEISLRNFDHYLQQGNLYYNLMGSDIRPDLSTLYCPDGPKGDVTGCFLVGTVQGDRKMELSIEYLYLNEDADNNLAVYAMISKAITQISKEYNKNTVINVYGANNRVQEMLNQMIPDPVEKSEIAEYFYVIER